jgi:hypothetical protein
VYDDVMEKIEKVEEAKIETLKFEAEKQAILDLFKSDEPL